jgi:hypothetical protein
MRRRPLLVNKKRAELMFQSDRMKYMKVYIHFKS